MVIDLFKQYSCMKCLFFALFISFKYGFHVDAEFKNVRRQEISAWMVLKKILYGAKILPYGRIKLPIFIGHGLLSYT